MRIYSPILSATYHTFIHLYLTAENAEGAEVRRDSSFDKRGIEQDKQGESEKNTE